MRIAGPQIWITEISDYTINTADKKITVRVVEVVEVVEGKCQY